MNLSSRKRPPSPWHPDFSNLSRLPDVKLVRTDFIVSFLGIILALSLLVVFSMRMMRVSSAHSEIKQVQASVAEKTKQNDQAKLESRVFEKESRLANLYKDFVQPSLDPLDVLVAVGKLHVADIFFSKMSFEENHVNAPKDAVTNTARTYRLTMEGVAQGNYDQALNLLNGYKDKLKDLEIVRAHKGEIEVRSLKRDTTGASISFELTVDFFPSK